nr:hypothetical protein [Tanacetum cinerariifolium]
MVNKTIGIGVRHVHSRNKVNHQNLFVSQAILLRSGNVNIPPARPQPVPTGKPKVFAQFPTGRQNMPFLVPTNRGYSPSENPFPDAEDEGVFDSGCSRSMTGNKPWWLPLPLKLSMLLLLTVVVSSSIPSGVARVPTGSDDYHQIIDFLRASHIRYALTHNPIIFDSLVKQFWSTSTLKSHELGPPAIQATIDETPYTITEDLVRSQLQLADDGGIDDFPIAKIYSGMDNLGTKFGSWDQFGSPLAVAFIYLSDGRQFNWSSYIFKGMTQLLLLSHELMILMMASSPMWKMNLWEALSICLHQGPLKPPACQTLGGAEDLITLTDLSFVVSTLVHKVNSLDTKLKDHKKLFKDVVGKL